MEWETEFFSLFREAIISRRREWGGRCVISLTGGCRKKAGERVVPVRDGRSTPLPR